ncbi:type VI secretion system-associated FHA domain protein [Tateyamaria armeniaca]|uniref:Type VI secretion system-associated FHA domain protein n=1 Tax=Tateyamaria armeniaca TaxID=2518930 RepID=A0ABW8UZ54_9RHOB
MKFMMDPDEAFTALFVQPRDGYQTGPDGFDNALTDIRQHQAAMMAAIQPALADMLEGLAPPEIEKDVGGGRLGSGARKSWEEYEKRWAARAAQGENGMLDAFLDAFARRYNQALDALLILETSTGQFKEIGALHRLEIHPSHHGLLSSMTAKMSLIGLAS